MSIGIGSSPFPSFVSPAVNASPEVVQMLESIAAQGSNSSYLSSFSPATAGLGAIGAVAAAILSPGSVVGRGVSSMVGQHFPSLYTPSIAGMVQNSSFATTIANTMGGGNANGTLQTVAATMGTSESQVVANMGPGVRDLYNQLLKDDPKQARAFLIQEMMSSLKIMGEILSNVSKTRASIAETFARNSRAG